MIINSYIFSSAPSYTARTTAFATATAITDTTILNALNTFDLGLISNGLDTKMKALYPFVGGTSTTHKYNFMDARDLDIAFRLQFNGGWTHSANGALGNGTNAYANSYYSNLTDDSSIWYYSRTNKLSGAENEMGVFTVPFSNNGIALYSSGTTYLYVKIAGGGDVNFVPSNTLGLFGANRTSSNVLNGWQNGVKKGTNVNTSSSNIANLPLTINAYNNGGLQQSFSSKECAFSSICNGLTDGEASIFYNLVQAFQTSLSRQV